MTGPRRPYFDALDVLDPGIWNRDGLVDAFDTFLDKRGISRGDEQTDAFGKALAVILKHEGGFVNNKHDPGGMTNLGVTKSTLEGWTGRRVTEQEMRALTPPAVAPIYRKNYWEAVQCDKLPAGLALCVFDFAVNAGPARAARYLQKMVGAATDGIAGDATLRAVQQFIASVGEAEAVRRYQESRRVYYKQLPKFSYFGRGWLRRVDETERTALEWAT